MSVEGKFCPRGDGPTVVCLDPRVGIINADLFDKIRYGYIVVEVADTEFIVGPSGKDTTTADSEK